jgi:hypothetical protein
MVSLQVNNTHFCWGTLTARDVILTAAHCSLYLTYDAVLGVQDIVNNLDYEVLD